MAFPSSASPNAGIFYMLIGMALFTANDAIGKWLVEDYSVGQVIALRSLAALVVLIPLAWRGGLVTELRHLQQPRLHLFRVILVVAEVSCFYWAVRYLPLADVFIFYLAAPIFTTALSALVLKEKVGPWRWGAVVVGFGGVLLIFPPSSAALSLPALIALVGSFALALMMILARVLRGVGGLTLVTLQTSGVFLAGSATLPFVWVTPDLTDFALLCLLGLVATSAHFLLNLAMRVSEPAVVAPFQYSSLIWAFILGYIFWGDVPGLQSLAGAALIIACGLFIFFREARLKGTA